MRCDIGKLRIATQTVARATGWVKRDIVMEQIKLFKKENKNEEK